MSGLLDLFSWQASARAARGGGSRRPKRAPVLLLAAAVLMAVPSASSADDEIMAIRLHVTNLAGTPITQAHVGTTFRLNAFAEDLRPSPPGVFGAWLDVTFPDALVTPSGGFVYPGPFQAGRSGLTDTPGLLDEAGAFTVSPELTGGGEIPLWRIDFTADMVGAVVFAGNAPDDSPDHDNLVFGLDEAVTAVLFGTANLNVVEGRAPPSSSALPKKVVVRRNASAPARAKLTSAGFLDLGPTAASPTAALSLDVGDTAFPAFDLTRKGARTLIYRADGVQLKLVPSKAGSSRATFKLKVTGPAAQAFDPHGTLTLRFRDDTVGMNALGTVQLADDRFLLGRERGALTAPEIAVVKAKAKLAGAGKDALKLQVNLTAFSGMPVAAPDVTVEFGDVFTVTLSSAAFQAKGAQAFVLQDNPPGVRSAVLDYRRGTLKLSAKGIDLGAFPEGMQPVTVTVDTGAPVSVTIGMARAGKKLSY